MDTLPEELLSAIFSHLEPDDLQRVSLVNTVFARITRPLLYSHCDTTYGDFDGEDDDTERIERLLSVFMFNPQLARFVEELTLGAWHTDCFTESSELASLNLTELTPILLHSPFGNDMEDALEDRQTDAYIAIMLSIMPKLKSLSMNLYHYRYDDQGTRTYEPIDFMRTMTIRLIRLATLSTAPPHGLSILNNLTEAHLRGPLIRDDAPWVFDVSVASVFLNLPSLRTLEVILCAERDNAADWKCNENVSNVKTLMFDICQIGHATIQKALRSCKSLQSFVCKRFCAECRPHCEGSSSYADIHLDLTKHAPSLGKLCIHSMECDGQNGFDPHEEPNEEPILTFATLHSLRELEVDEYALYGPNRYEAHPLVEILPITLEKIRLKVLPAHDQDEILHQVPRLLLSSQTLKEVTVEDVEPDDWEVIEKQWPDIIFDRKDREFVARRRSLAYPTATS